MNNRRTEIVDCEIEDFDDVKDELFTQLSDSFKDENRLMKRFFNFCEEYNDFEFDEMGINLDEPDEILRKANKIRDLFLSNVEEKIVCTFHNIETIILTRSVHMNVTIKSINYTIIIEIMSDSFNLELL